MEPSQWKMKFRSLWQICVAATMIFLGEEAMAIAQPSWDSSYENFIPARTSNFGYDYGYTSNPGISTPEECNRECVDGEPSKICYYHFTLENYNVLGGACKLCTPNATNSIKSECQCVLADGVERGFLSANRMLPGPSIQVCEGDKVVIDVANHMHGMETALHWHGIFQNGYQYYDGVPFLTQCPIPEGTTFRYQWTANNAGTHFWHTHAGLQKLDGLYGSLIVRQTLSRDLNSELYDEDSSSHIVIISDWMHQYAVERFPGLLTPGKTGQYAQSVLINGMGQAIDPNTGQMTNTPLAVFTIKSGVRYRFRLINSFATVCPANITIEGHNLTVIATDGEAVSPVVVNTIVSYTGERYDFVIKADQPVGAYWIQLRAIGECGINRVQNLGILRYEDGPESPTSARPTYDNGLPLGVVLNPLDSYCNTPREDAICVNQLKSVEDVDPGLLQGWIDQRAYVPFKFYQYAPENIFKPGTYKRFLIPPPGDPLISLVDGISFTFPPSPPLSQYGDSPDGQFCNSQHRPVGCGADCSCTNEIAIPMDSTFEMVLADMDPATNLTHPFHLHGYAFHVVGMGKLPQTNEVELQKAVEMDLRRLVNKTVDRPPSKDTIAVPEGGYVILRLRANNPGYWLFHCHFEFHLAIGMALVLHVGRPYDLPPIPPGFPTCGNFWPPIELP